MEDNEMILNEETENNRPSITQTIAKQGRKCKKAWCAVVLTIVAALITVVCVSYFSRTSLETAVMLEYKAAKGTPPTVACAAQYPVDEDTVLIVTQYDEEERQTFYISVGTRNRGIWSIERQGRWDMTLIHTSNDIDEETFIGGWDVAQIGDYTIISSMLYVPDGQTMHDTLGTNPIKVTAKDIPGIKESSGWICYTEAFGETITLITTDLDQYFFFIKDMPITYVFYFNGKAISAKAIRKALEQAGPWGL